MRSVADALKFVRGAVASKEFVPELTHFRLRNGRISAFNGSLSLGHAINLDLDVAPKAKFFERALQSVPDDVPVSMTLTTAGRLSIKAGKFRVLVHCQETVHDDLFPQPDGTLFPAPDGILWVKLCRTLRPFIAEDASRPWAQSILLHGREAYATNNNILVAYDFNEEGASVSFKQPLIIPLEAVKEIIRIGVEPTHLQIGRSSVTFHYPDEAWMRAQLLESKWPELGPVLDQPFKNMVTTPPEFYEDIKRLETFITDSSAIFVKGPVLSTTGVDGEGASIDTPLPLGDGVFHVKILASIAAVAETINLGARPAVFKGHRLRGVAMHMRDPNGAV